MKQFKNLLCLLAVVLAFQVGNAQTVIIPGNAYAFQWSGDPDIGLYFSAANSRYEFRDLVGSPEWWCNPIIGLTYFRNDLVVGATSNSNGRLEVANAGANASAVAARGALGPTNGYLGAQGSLDFDGVLSLDISGQEVGVLGVSTGGSATDNSGVYGHSNGRGVYGEHSTSGNNAALGTSGYSVDADGVARINGGTDVAPASGGYLVVGVETGLNITTDNNEIMARNGGAVSTLFFNNNGGDVSSGNATTQHTLNGSVDMIGSGFQNATTIGPWFMGSSTGTGLGYDGNEVQSYLSGTAGGTFYANFWGGTTSLSWETGTVSMGNSTSTGDVTMNSSQFSLDGATGALGIGKSGNTARTDMELLHDLGGPNDGLAITNESGDQNGWNLYTLSTGNLLFYSNDGSTGTSTNDVTFVAGDGLNTLSDQRFKEDFQPVENTLEDLLTLEPMSYYYKHDKNRDTRSIGFMAQDLKDVFPNIVNEVVTNELTGESQMMVNYIELIPVMIAAMKEQDVKHEDETSKMQDQIDDLQSQLDAQADMMEDMAAMMARLDKDLSACCTSSTSDVAPVAAERASLSQNIPNPFNGTTTINYYLPKDATFATIKVVDVNGSIVKEFNLQGEGFGQVSFVSNELAGGNYFYSLFIDGSIVDTKQMNLIK